MDNTNWRAAQAQAQAQAQIPGQVMSNEAAAAQGMETGDWRTQLQADSRQRIVNKIMDTLKKHLPFSGQEGLQELKKIAVRFEEKIYTAATSQSDYLRKISLKMLTMETKSQNPMTKNPQDAASQSMQLQIQNQVQQQPLPMVSNQPQVRQQQLPQSNMTSAVAPNSASMTSGLVPGGLSQGNMPNVAGCQNPNMQNIQDISSVNPNVVGGTSMGQQGVPFANSQRQIPGRQQQEQQQSHNSQQLYIYNQQLQHHLMKQKLQQGNIPQSLLQSQIQQQQMQTTQLQSSHHAGGIQQPSLRQSSASSSNLQQNQQSSLQQATQSMLQQQSQPILRPPPQQQVQSQQQQHQLSAMQQNLMPQQPNTSNMQHNQLIGQQNSILDAQHQQQQRLMAQQNNMQQQQTTSQQNNLSNMQQQQQNNLPSIHQQQLGPQNNLSGFQQPIVGSQHGSLGLQANQQSVMLQQSKVATPQKMQQTMPNLLPNQQNQQPQLQPPQQQMMSQIQSQPGQMQQLGLQQAGNPLQRDMQQRIQSSGSLIQQPAMIDQQKQLMQSQRITPEVPLTSVDSSSHAGNTNSGDWQEEIFQKIKSMNEMYYHDLNEIYQRMAAKLQQHDSLPQQPKNEQLEKLRYFKVMLEKLIMFLQTNKNEIQPSHKDKYAAVEKQIINILNSNRPRKPVSTLQPGQVSQSQMHAMQQSQQPQPQISQMHSHENQMSSHLQQMNAQGSVATVQQNNLTNLQHNSLSSISNTRQNNMDALQSGSNIDSGQGKAMNSIQQVAVNSMQQNPVSGPQQMNINSIASQGGVTTLQSNVNSLHDSASLLQPQNIKQEQQMFSTQQLKQQYQQRQMQQQYIQRQHLLQQQHQTTAQQSAQLHAQQIGQLNQINDPNDMKMRQQFSGKSGVLQQHQRPSYQHQLMKTGAPFSISSPQLLQAASPQIGHHPSPQLEHTKAGTPMQSANSPFIVPSPSTSMVLSPMPGDSEKINSGVSSLSNAGNNVQRPNTGASVTAQSLAIGTPGLSASPLLAEFTSPDGTQGVASTIVSENANAVEKPLERLLKVVKSMSQKALSASVSDISSVVSMVDRIAGSAPGNGSRAAVGEDLVAMTKCRLQARNFFTQEGPSGSKKMRRYTSAIPSNIVSSTGSVNDSLRHLNGCESDGESTGASSIKKPRLEANHALEEELREINQRLIDTVLYISEDDVDPTAVSAAAEGGEGIIVKCSFIAVALCPNLKSQYASAQMSPIQPLRLLIPKDYPNCSPILLDKFPVEVSKEYEDLSIKAKSRFSISLRSLTQPMSLGEIARTWDICARTVISEYAQQSGGGSFSTKYGTWETCLSGA